MNDIKSKRDKDKKEKARNALNKEKCEVVERSVKETKNKDVRKNPD